jgi:hypothetical protein
LQQFAATSGDDAYGDTLEKQEAAKVHLQEVMTELDAIASMEVVDALIDGTDGFIDILRKGRREEAELAAAALREPLQKFLSVNSLYGSALRECYAAADSALDTFQQVLSRDSSVALAQLASALGVLSTTDAFAASRNRR